ncbi:MAG: hypothetical protein EZS28_012410 [Streblomastix strix]|uniref:Uncharacterized protein n=1 Tax=Streblomastix strix TaxID=222440 RepID=A0A5J4WB78_9EUKA|nr:MAG: hypothetical protein EZS28_012410 [Streblomastix strix]
MFLEASKDRERQEKEKQSIRIDLEELRKKTVEKENDAILQQLKQFETNKQKNNSQIDDIFKLIQIDNQSTNTTHFTQQQMDKTKQQLERVEQGTDEQKNTIKVKKTIKCQQILSHIIGKKDIECRNQAFESGVTAALINFLTTQPFQSINQSHIWTIYELINGEVPFLPQIYDLKPFQVLFRLLDHPDVSIVYRAVLTMQNLLSSAEQITTSDSTQHPLLQDVVSCDGINKIYSLYKKKVNDRMTNATAYNLALLLIAGDNQYAAIQNDLIAYLKSDINNTASTSKDNSIKALKFLARNEAIREEIEKDGFKIPE